MSDSYTCGDIQKEASGDVFCNGLGVARMADATMGHTCWPPTFIVESSGNVFVNGRGMARIGDAHAGHTCPTIPETHGGDLSTGSDDTFCNGL